jgi:anti-sigma28 factor (negative regulator of flagellin synthesis)
MQHARRHPKSPTIAAPDSDSGIARQEKLAAIRRAIEAGYYDNDDILEQAFNRMLQKVQSERHAD